MAGCKYRVVTTTGVASIACAVAAAGFWIAAGVEAKRVLSWDFLAQNSTELTMTVAPDSNTWAKGLNFYMGRDREDSRCESSYLSSFAPSFENWAVPSQVEYRCQEPPAQWLQTFEPELQDWAGYTFPMDLLGHPVAGTYTFKSPTPFWVLDARTEVGSLRPRLYTMMGWLAAAAVLTGITGVLACVSGYFACSAGCCARTRGFAKKQPRPDAKEQEEMHELPHVQFVDSPTPGV